MALSQLQCLDDNHVNPRVHESKPEFLYCEDQRLALEALLRDGREAFLKYLEARGLRLFLSDPEVEALAGAVEPYDPGSKLFSDSGEDDETPLSMHYWPELSDTSIPQIDLGWPDSDAYRGVTRTTVHTQPPLDGQAHIKEIVRKMIAQAQKVIAVVMDVFTDVDIFRDLLDAGFKRRVSVYILLERTTLPHFLSMCQRANMHAGHLKAYYLHLVMLLYVALTDKQHKPPCKPEYASKQLWTWIMGYSELPLQHSRSSKDKTEIISESITINVLLVQDLIAVLTLDVHLRVRCTDGVEFHTRSSTKVRGRVGHRFMFIDGDKAVSGSYSFTWMSSRLEKNLITVVTGQAVDAFDRLFRTLYATSSSVELRQVATEPEPEPDPIRPVAAVAPPSAALARKLYNPKYALALGNPSPAPSADQNSSEKTQSEENTEVPGSKKKRRKRASKDKTQEAPPIHPGLLNLEKACLMSYLPTWPEPDPSSDVIGFINIRDSSKPTPVHLQRSEMFGTSQAIRFSSPFSMPEKTLPEVATPRQQTAKHEEINKLQSAQDKTKAKESQPTQLNAQPGDVTNKAKVPEHNSPASGTTCESAKSLSRDNQLLLNTATNPNVGHNTAPHLKAHAPPQNSSRASPPSTGRPSHHTQDVPTDHPKSDALPGSKTKETILNKPSAVVRKTHTLESNSTAQPSQKGQHTQTRTDSHTKAVHTQPPNPSEMTPKVQTPVTNSYVSPSSPSATCSQPVSSTSLSKNDNIAIGSPLTVSSTNVNPPLLSSSTLTSTPPIPKPRTLQLVVKDGVTSSDQKLQEFSVIRRRETSTGPPVVSNEPAVATVVEKSPEAVPETVPKVQNNSESRTQQDAKNMGNISISQETKNDEAVGLHNDRAEMQLVAGTNFESQPNVLIIDAPKAESMNIHEIIPKDVESKTLTSTDCKLTSQKDCGPTAEAPERAPTDPDSAEVEPRKKTYRASAHELQRISYSAVTPQDLGILDAADSVKSPTHTPVSAKDSTGDSTRTSATDAHGQPGNGSFPPAQSVSNTAKNNSNSITVQELTPNTRGGTHTPEKLLRLHLSETHAADFLLPTPEREFRSLAAFVRTPTPTLDGFTPDQRSYTPDIRTPTSDMSDEYVSPRTDSARSTTSDEYYECADSPFQEPVVDQVAYGNHATTEDHVSATHTDTPNATTVATSAPALINDNTRAYRLGIMDMNTSSSETLSLSRPTSDSSLSSLLEEVKTGEETADEENGRKGDERGSKLSAAESRTVGNSLQRQGSSEEAERTPHSFKQGEYLTQTVGKNKAAQAQVPKRKRGLNQSGAEKLVDGAATPGELNNEEVEPKRLSTGDLKPKKDSSERGRPDKEKTVSSGVERKGRPQSATETERQKLCDSRRMYERESELFVVVESCGVLRLPTPPGTPRGQQQNRGASSPSRSSKSPRPLSTSMPLGAHPMGSRQSNQADIKAAQGSLSDNTSSARKPPPRPPPPGPAGRKQAEVLRSPQGSVSRQPPTAQGRARAGQSPSRHPYTKPQPLSPNQVVPAHQLHSQTEEGKGPFSLTFGKLYSLKGLKDKIGKLPTQNRRGSTSSGTGT
ncbi:Protein FAM83G [Collichthys lucidus]|uniref:Protein FAM83G n=1 Tax=Collichthys lucidus TaxID=240159 RepID=A0A4U5VTA2_COLLU|nr:Protein FAM83G [Collichthys lucidus]